VHRARGLLAEEPVIAMTGPEHLNPIPVRQRELRRPFLLEDDVKPQHVAQEPDHLVVALGPNAQPADPDHLHGMSMTDAAMDDSNVLIETRPS
jgi:hypothetical protein